MDKKYVLELDLVVGLYNPKMRFNQGDKRTSDFYIKLTNNGEIIENLDRAMVTLVAIRPDKSVEAQFIEVKNGLLYADLKRHMKCQVGVYRARAMVVIEGEVIRTDMFKYEVDDDGNIDEPCDDNFNDDSVVMENLSEILNKLAELELKCNEREEIFNTRLNNLEDKQADTSNKISNLSSLEDNVNNKINEYDKILDNQDYKINSIYKRQDNYDERISAVEAKVDYIEDVEDLDAKFEQLDSKIDKVNSKVKEINSTLQEHLDDYAEEINNIYKKQDKLSTKVDRVDSEINDLDDKIDCKVDNLKTKIDLFDNKLDIYDNKYAIIDNKIDDLEHRLNNINTETTHNHSNKHILDQITQELIDAIGSAQVDLSAYQMKRDEGLNTDDKSIVGAINELHQEFDSFMNRFNPIYDEENEELIAPQFGNINYDSDDESLDIGGLTNGRYKEN